MSLFAVTTLRTVLLPASNLRNTIFKLACGKDAPTGFLNSSSNEVHAEHTETSEFADAQLECEGHVIQQSAQWDTLPSSSSNFDPEELKQQLQVFADQLKEKTDRDPDYFGAAIRTFLQNKEKFVQTDSNLITGLIMAFRPVSTRVSRKMGSLIKVNAAAISRRRSSYGGHRPGLVGRKAMSPALKLLRNAKILKCARRVHNLNNAVFRNLK